MSTVPDGPLTKDAYKIKELLQNNSKTAVVLTSLAEEMPFNESIELRQKLNQECNIKTSHLVINQMFPRLYTNQQHAHDIMPLIRSFKSPSASALCAHNEFADDRYNLNQRYLQKFKNSFADLPIAQLPFLFNTPLDFASLQTLKKELLTPHD